MNSLFIATINSLMAITANQQHIPVNELPLDHDKVQKLVTSGNIRPLDDYLTWVAQYCDGQLVDAQLFQYQDKWRYDLQFKLAQGHVINLQLDAVNGMQNPMSQLPSECTKHETATR